jgi:hypothetical protein
MGRVQITKTNFAPGSLIPIKLSKAPAVAYLHVGMTLMPDPDIGRLVVQRSRCGLYAHDDDFESMIYHYDFDREPENEYPDAHFQVGGTNEHVDVMSDRAKMKKTLPELHFPVGGRRYRPSVEDSIEFLIIEGFAASRDGWREAIDEHRERWN